MPIFILFLGVALDLGWYYLNVTRLQNAADAAAVAGAQTLIESEDFSAYKNVSLVGSYPGKVSNQYRADNIYQSTTIENSKVVAEEYARKNLSGNKDKLVNAWTKNEIQSEEPTLYVKEGNLYFVVQLKDSIKHFFLPGWFGDMDAPVTAVAMLSKNANANIAGDEEDNAPKMADLLSKNGRESDSPLPTMPSMPEDERKPTEEFKDGLDLTKNKNVIIGNWEVQNAYKSDTTKNTEIEIETESGEKKKVMVTQYEAIFGTAVYGERWNFFQDTLHHYTAGGFYRTQTVSIQDDVNFTESNSVYTTTTYGAKSDVHETKAAATSSNPKGLPYAWKIVDSIDVDFQPEVTLSGDWLSEDWDLTIEKNFPTSYMFAD